MSFARSPAIGVAGRLPRWLQMALAVLAVLLGGFLMIRPTLSLGVLALLVGAGFVVHGALVLIGDRDEDAEQATWWRRVRMVEGVLWIAAGAFVVAFMGLTVRLLAIVIAAGLIVTGVRSLVEALRRGSSGDTRIASGALGLASVGLGLLALLWPDITLLVAAVAFGARLLLIGLVQGRTALLGETPRTMPRPAGRFRRLMRMTGAIVALLLVVGAGAVSVGLHEGSPVVDDFYAAPRGVPDAPGQLIRSEPFTRGVPEDAIGWRILYTTTRGDGSPAVASGLVVVPKAGDGDWPVIAWHHGTTGFGQQCAPSLLDEPFASGALFTLPEIIDQGWALVAPDYIGLGAAGPHPYLIGEDSAHASLDAAGAAQQLAPARISADTVLWGHSQGGGAALWSGALAADYAPGLEIHGVAALAPAANLPGLVDHLPNVTGGSVFASFVVAAYTATYPDITWREYIRPGAEQMIRSMSERCLSEPGMLVSVLDALALSRDPEVFRKDPATGPFGVRLQQNVPPATIPVPVLIGQGAADTLIIPAAQQDYVEQAQANGEQIDYRTYPGLDHVPLVEAGSPLIPELLAWTQDRFADS
ncbi:MAG TPA: lipase family protein [Arachnia sp.]|nr:lipase family protein [Arachnia sp.]HMT84797.1 lipase family protein [Arachnia sp.]